MSEITEELTSKLHDLGKTFVRTSANGKRFFVLTADSVVFTVSGWKVFTESLVKYIEKHFESKENNMSENNNRVAVCDEGCCELEEYFNRLSSTAREMYAILATMPPSYVDAAEDVQRYRAELTALGVLHG